MQLNRGTREQQRALPAIVYFPSYAQQHFGISSNRNICSSDAHTHAASVWRAGPRLRVVLVTAGGSVC